MPTTQAPKPAPVGLCLTLDALTTTKNEAAVEILVHGLDSADSCVQLGSLRALLERRSHLGQREILRRLANHADVWRPIIDERQGRLAHALRDGLLSTDDAMCRSACQAILWFREYDLAAALITAAEDESNPHASLAAETLLSLADQLYEELAAPPDYSHRRDPQAVRRNFTTVLEGSVQRFARHKRVEALRAFLSLTARDNATLRKILQDPHHSAYLPVVDVLLHDQRGGVVRLLLSFLDDPQAPSAAVSAMMRRSDRKFITNMLRRVGASPSINAAQNIKKMEAIGWLRHDPNLVDDLDDAAQHSLVQVIMTSNLKRAEAFPTIERLTLTGRQGGRRAAALALARFNGADANQVALKALADQDPQVLAAIVGQLRPRGIPGALNRVIEMLDHPHPIVREAARQSLSEFSFDRYLAAYDLLEDEIRETTGVLVKKISPNVVDALRDELAARSRSRRIRGLGVAVAMNAVDDILGAIVKLMTDDDHLVRAEAARALGHSTERGALAALREALNDRSVPVQEAALRSLQQLDNHPNLLART
jgi:HEAT repeat protein